MPQNKEFCFEDELQALIERCDLSPMEAIGRLEVFKLELYRSWIEFNQEQDRKEVINQ